MKKTIIRNYKSGSQAKGYDTGSNVYQQLNKNAEFANEQPVLDIFKAAKDALDFAKGEAFNGDSVKIAIKNELYKVFIQKLDKVADAVESKADGDIKIAQKSGFDTVSTVKRSIDFLGTPTGLKADDVKGRKGFIKVAWDYDPDSVNTAVECQVQGEPNAPWVVMTVCTASSTLISGLPSGKYVAVRVYSMGRKGLKSDTSESVMVLVS